MNIVRPWLEWLRSLWRKPPPRLCEYCSGPMPKDAPPEQKYCKASHKRKAQALRTHGTTHPKSQKARLDAAWGLNSTYEDHAASCARKTGNGGAYSLGDALQARRWLVEDTGNSSISAYLCKVCGRYHLTSGDRKERTS